MVAGYHAYGATSADWVTALSTVSSTQVYTPAGGVSVTVWDAQTGGNQITDLLAADGTTPLTQLTTDADGSVPRFYAPDTLSGGAWLDGGASGRVQAVSVEHGFVHTVAGQAPDDSGDVALSAANVGAADAGHIHDDRYYTETEVDTALAAKQDAASLAAVATSGDYADLIGTPVQGLAGLPAGVTVAAHFDTVSGTWPARPTGRTDITVWWIGGTQANPPAGQLTGDVLSTSAS